MRRGSSVVETAGFLDVLNRIKKKIRIEEVAKRLSDKLIRFVTHKRKEDDLTNDEAGLIYRDVNLDQVLPLSKSKDVEIDWTNHAKYRSELRDVDPRKLNETVRDKLRDRRMERRVKDRGDERFKEPGVGTAVVVYDNLSGPNGDAEADVITTWR